MEKSLKAKVILMIIKNKGKDEKTKSKELNKCINEHFRKEYGYKDIVGDFMKEEELNKDSYFFRFICKYQHDDKYNQFLEDVNDASLYLMLFN